MNLWITIEIAQATTILTITKTKATKITKVKTKTKKTVKTRIEIRVKTTITTMPKTTITTTSISNFVCKNNGIKAIKAFIPMVNVHIIYAFTAFA